VEIIEHTYDIRELAKIVPCKITDFRELHNFIVSWNIAVHGGKP